MTYRAIDCQGFAGGFTLGVAQAGFKLVGKREMQGGFGVANCEANRHLLGHDWVAEAVVPEAWSVPFGGADLVFGNPPCSGFSVLSSKSFRGADSKINHCMWAFAEYAAKVRPTIAIFESVQLAFAQGHDLMKNLRAKLEEQSGHYYRLYHVLHNAYSVGGPAQRRRYFWVVSRVPFGIERIPPARVPQFRDVVSDLIEQPESWGAQPYRSDPTWYSNHLRNPAGTVDGHITIDNPNTQRTRQLLLEGDWHPGEHAQAVTRRYFEKNGSLPSRWTHVEEKLKGQDFFMGYSTPTMWNPDNPARVITGAGLLNGVHWALPRTFTHREAARILGFPDTWLIEPLRGVSGLFMTWGKGITVHCGNWIARWASRALDGEPGTYEGEKIGDREWLIDVTHDWKGTCATVSSVAKILKKQKISDLGSNIVTEPAVQAEATAGTEAAVVNTNAGGRGRPRPEETRNRDEVVFKAIAGSDRPVTREEVATGTGLSANETYLSIYRLRRDGRIGRSRVEGKHVWSVVPNAEVA